MNSTDHAATVAKIRKHFATARTMHRNLRLGLYQGRNDGGGAAGYHVAQADTLARTLPRNLQGDVWAEHRLAERISENRDAGNDRPELRARITRLRREIRAAL